MIPQPYAAWGYLFRKVRKPVISISGISSRTKNLVVGGAHNILLISQFRLWPTLAVIKYVTDSKDRQSGLYGCSSSG
jgi:hypothetical protein